MKWLPSLAILAVLVAGSVWAVVASLGTAPVDRYKNALVPTLSLGEEVGDFALEDIGGELRSFSQWKGKEATVLYFWSVDCPCIDAVEMRIKAVQDKYRDRGVSFIAIDSHPDDTKPDVLKKMVDIHADYRMLLDPEGRVGKRVGGIAAADAVVLDGQGRIRFRGGIAEKVVKPEVDYLSAALDAILSGKAPEHAETPILGCPYPGYEGICESRRESPARKDK